MNSEHNGWIKYGLMNKRNLDILVENSVAQCIEPRSSDPTSGMLRNH